MKHFGIPSIGQIQRTTSIVAVVMAAVLALTVSSAAAVGCLLGGAVMMANLYVLSAITRGLFAAAQQAGRATPLGVLAIPLKMLIFIAIVYLIIDAGRISVAGFVAGSLTQFAAIFIETWRASMKAPLGPEDADGWNRLTSSR